MTEEKSEKHKQLAHRILSKISTEEKDALGFWADQLLAIKRSDYSKITKGKEAIQLTARSQVIVPVLKIIAGEFKLDRFDVSKIKFSSFKQVE